MQRPVPGSDPADPNWSTAGFTDQTVRQVIRTSGAGSRVRIRLSNRYGTQPLRLAGATIATTRDGASVVSGTVRSLTFHGTRGTTLDAAPPTAATGSTVVLERSRPY